MQMESPRGTEKSNRFIRIQCPTNFLRCPDIAECFELDNLVSEIKALRVRWPFGVNTPSRPRVRGVSQFSKKITEKHERWSKGRLDRSEDNSAAPLSSSSESEIEPFSSSIPGLGKDIRLNYYDERSRYRSDGTLFCDPQFPAEDSSLYFNKKPKEIIVWRRPHDIVEKPKFIVDGHSRFDARQGELGNCWFIAAVANLALHDELFNRVVPADQDFAENYAGIFHFHFWRYGKWVDVVIDDRLPTVYDFDPQQKICRPKVFSISSTDKNEFWSCLLEKAYAKMYGCYEAIVGATGLAEAMVDFTGGLTERYSIGEISTRSLALFVLNAYRTGSMLGCGINNLETEEERRSFQEKTGLIAGHAYSITGFEFLETQEVLLIRIRNPWGNRIQWKGDWGDDSEKWDEVTTEEKKRLQFSVADDGEWWMSIQDFHKMFSTIEVCTLDAEALNKIHQMASDGTGSYDHPWQSASFDGGWDLEEHTSGGSYSTNSETFYRNPQFAISVQSEGTGDGKEKRVTLIVGLMKKYHRELKKVIGTSAELGKRLAGLMSTDIGFTIFRCDKPALRKRDSIFFRNAAKKIVQDVQSVGIRQVTTRVYVESGDYVIVPFAGSPSEQGDFLLRIFANGTLNARRLQ